MWRLPNIFLPHLHQIKLKYMERFIVTDEKGKPMAWGGDQLCYCTDEYWQDEPFPIKTYSEQAARRYIKKSIAFRTENGFSDNYYKLMPITIPTNP